MNLLLVATLICISDYIVPLIIVLVMAKLFSKEKVNKELSTEILSIKRELETISMVDEFAKYARLSRKYNALESTLNEKINEWNNQKLKVQSYCLYCFKAINGIFTIVLLYLHRSSPVITFPKDTLWPLNCVLSWPSTYHDAISLTMWLLISKTVLSMYKKRFKNWII
ncbi:guided entry of tail-anchored proteins factor 1-like [Prorops nasuta]|uniref:guided entry of tail-anchored proteins factor 1-like n=1 Tax=Prorops nasuta TaxID=863751 RepID=UPI0034CFEF77